MTSLTDTQVVTASGGLVELGYAEVTSPYTTTTSSAGNTTPFIGPITIVSDGSPIVVEFSAPSCNNAGAAGAQVVTNLVVDGVATGYLCSNYSGFSNTPQSIPYGGKRRLTLSAGSHTIACSAWHGGAAGTINMGSGSGGNWSPGLLRVSKIVQATQWPAVTTGTIICTSSTRPASPFEGQQIYETDTDKQLVWNASAWKQMAGSSATFSDDLTVSGNLFRPNNPMFSASGTVGSSGNWNTYVSVTANVGSYFNTSTGVFTTPTAGYYFFIATGFKEYSAGSPTQYYLTVNGVGYKRSYTDAPVNRYAATPGTNAIFYLNVGDAVAVTQTNGTMHTGSNMHFSGWMIG